ncbi:hypothetical protein DLAC_07842 [Tieghemostelium lacteum]|uniref:SAM domain-containing protein n=1 Tax=Tieghemostelium lacteum TaxID=361077 RepID=A0A151ZAJ1_TIELA|nr:hypothetical protein DLAC_07842 [Tieghemostelium lacteum]|eukprot:KYQ90959.1 hypothetical protein DLAC_07842 [Tieghemostelium lacteum]
MNSNINNPTTVTTSTPSSTNNQKTINILDPTTSEYPDINWNIEQTNAWAARFLPMEDLQKFKEANFNGEELSNLQRDDLNGKVKISFGQSILLFQRISKGIALSQPTKMGIQGKQDEKDISQHKETNKSQWDERLDRIEKILQHNKKLKSIPISDLNTSHIESLKDTFGVHFRSFRELGYTGKLKKNKTHKWINPKKEKKAKKENEIIYDEESNMESIFSFLKTNYKLPIAYEFRDCHKKQYLLTFSFTHKEEDYQANGSGDFVVVPKSAGDSNALINSEIIMIIEIKSPGIKIDDNVSQIIFETLSSKASSLFPVLGVLTNLVNCWYLFWVNQPPYGIGYCKLLDERNFSKAVSSPNVKDELNQYNSDTNILEQPPQKKLKITNPSTTTTTTTKQHLKSNIGFCNDIANLDDITYDDDNERMMVQSYKTKFVIDNIIKPMFKNNN